MKKDNVYAIFYCDDCDLLIPVINIFNKIHSEIKVRTTSDVDDLLAKVRRKAPALILVYLHDPNKSYISVVKKIRENVNTTTIPIHIYRSMPTEEELESVFKKLQH